MKSPIFQLILVLFLLISTNCKIPALYESPNIKISESGIIFFDDYTLEEKLNLSEDGDRVIIEDAFGEKGRKFIQRNWKALFNNKRNLRPLNGKIAMMICANRDGVMKYGEIITEECSITDRNILVRALNASRGYIVEMDQNAPYEECGKFIFNLDVSVKSIKKYR